MENYYTITIVFKDATPPLKIAGLKNFTTNTRDGLLVGYTMDFHDAPMKGNPLYIHIPSVAYITCDTEQK